MTVLPPDLSREAFAPHVGSRFELEVAPGEAVAFELVAADALAPSAATPRTPFVLTFRSGEPTVRPQRIYALTHPAMGRLEIFLVPVGRDPAGVRYEAVFS
jgi:hypothetical protein